MNAPNPHPEHRPNAAFENLRPEQAAMLAELAAYGFQVFLARPRDFDMNAFEVLFREGPEVRSVIQLDLDEVADFSDPDDFREQLAERLAEAIRRAGFPWTRPTYTPVSPGNDFWEWLSEQPYTSVVVLIENYDVPVLRIPDDSALRPLVARSLEAFLLAIKHDAPIRFAFVTGETEDVLVKELPRVNHFDHITTVRRYATICDRRTETR